MFTRRSFLIGSTACAAAIARPAKPEATGLRKIVPGVWFFAGDFLSTGRCNSVVIERKNDLVVVDANSAGGAGALQAEVKRLSAKPVRYVLLTHHHGDHIYGSAVWTRAGALTVAHQSMLGELAHLEPARWRMAAARDPEVAALGDAPELPRHAFTGAQWVLDDDERRIEVHSFGAGHTRDDVVVYLPREQVLCTGDIAINTSLNSFFDCDFRHWPKALRAVVQLSARHVLPGHGEPGGVEIIEGQEQFLAALDKAVTGGLQSGLSPVQIAAGLHLPDSLHPWVGSNLPQQVAQIYAQLAADPK
jgi:cyclase